jgi:hypothetical protein
MSTSIDVYKMNPEGPADWLVADPIRVGMRSLFNY